MISYYYPLEKCKVSIFLIKQQKLELFRLLFYHTTATTAKVTRRSEQSNVGMRDITTVRVYVMLLHGNSVAAIADGSVKPCQQASPFLQVMVIA